jgi:CRP/FNR family transcriptional regulator
MDIFCQAQVSKYCLGGLIDVGGCYRRIGRGAGARAWAERRRRPDLVAGAHKGHAEPVYFCEDKVQTGEMSSTFSEFKQAAVVNTLRSCQLFSGLALADLNAVAEISILKTLEKGDYLFREREPGQGFYIVQKGAINVHRVSPMGKEQVIRVFRAKESFAEATLATDAGYPADARAVESSQVLLVQKAGFLAVLRRQPELALRMLASMSVHLRTLVGQLEDLTLKDVETRLANWLIKRCPVPGAKGPVRIELKTTKRVLAAELGTVSETLSRTLAKFRDQGLVRVEGKVLEVINPGGLTALLRRNLGE